jgi:hypothetical protein
MERTSLNPTSSTPSSPERQSDRIETFLETFWNHLRGIYHRLFTSDTKLRAICRSLSKEEISWLSPRQLQAISVCFSLTQVREFTHVELGKIQNTPFLTSLYPSLTSEQLKVVVIDGQAVLDEVAKTMNIEQIETLIDRVKSEHGGPFAYRIAQIVMKLPNSSHCHLWKDMSKRAFLFRSLPSTFIPVMEKQDLAPLIENYSLTTKFWFQEKCSLEEAKTLLKLAEGDKDTTCTLMMLLSKRPFVKTLLHHLPDVVDGIDEECFAQTFTKHFPDPIFEKLPQKYQLQILNHFPTKSDFVDDALIEAFIKDTTFYDPKKLWYFEQFPEKREVFRSFLCYLQDPFSALKKLPLLTADELRFILEGASKSFSKFPRETLNQLRAAPFLVKKCKIRENDLPLIIATLTPTYIKAIAPSAKNAGALRKAILVPNNSLALQQLESLYLYLPDSEFLEIYKIAACLQNVPKRKNSPLLFQHAREAYEKNLKIIEEHKASSDPKTKVHVLVAFEKATLALSVLSDNQKLNRTALEIEEREKERLAQEEKDYVDIWGFMEQLGLGPKDVGFNEWKEVPELEWEDLLNIYTPGEMPDLTIWKLKKHYVSLKNS